MTPEMLTSDVLSLRHGFFTRVGGVSSGIYASLQCGFGAKADSAENVHKNRRLAAEAIGAAPSRLVSLNQVHGAICVTFDDEFRRTPRADAMVTSDRDLALGILTADCAPVLFADREAGVIGAAHAGWRGALGGVLESTLTAMKKLGAERIVAAIGPCISQENYQVDAGYRARFIEQDRASYRFFMPDDVAEKFRFDLPGYVADRLRRAGLETVSMPTACTYADDARFFSNRRAVHRGEGDYGRGLSVIML